MLCGFMAMDIICRANFVLALIVCTAVCALRNLMNTVSVEGD